jgi:hypothetical protein
MRLEDVREAVYWWQIEYNEQRPHDARPQPIGSKTLETLHMNRPRDGEAYAAWRSSPPKLSFWNRPKWRAFMLQSNSCADQQVPGS